MFSYAQDVNRLRDRESELESNAFSDRYDEFDEDSIARIDPNTVPIDLFMWQIDARLGDIIPVPVDTLIHQFQNTVFTSGMNGEYNFLGNLGSPRESRIFFNRPLHSQFIFSDPYSAFLVKPQELKFTNTKSPFTNLSYYKGGSRRNGEERFNAYFSVNVNKKLGFGFDFDYWYGRGQYSNQNTSLFKGAFFSSYRSERYNLHAIYSQSQIKIAENGGIVDDRYITHPEVMAEINGGRQYNGTDIPVNFDNTWNRNKNLYVFLTHRYNLGFYRNSDEDTEDDNEFIPVSSFIHTLNVERNYRRFIVYRNSSGEQYYQHHHFRNDSTNDITKNISVKNTFGISLQEGFSKWAKAGLTAFLTHEYRTFTLPDTLNSSVIFEQQYNENVISVGGEFAKRQGRLLHYNITGDLAVIGEDIGQFNLYGNMDLNFRLFSDTVRLDANAYIKRIHPSFYYRKFHSNHYWWSNEDLSKEIRTRIEGRLTIDRWKTQLNAGVENIKNYLYFARNDYYYTTPGGEEASRNNIVVKQASENIQVFSATLKQDFKLGIFHLDNEVTYQTTSNSAVLPLPTLNLYHNLYLSAKLAKRVLTLELGADMRYFTKYAAPDYTPAIGQFTQQDQNNLVEIGGYPFINVYANVHLKRTRFYVMMAHVNQGSGNSNYFTVPHYPVNPRMFMLGLSWNFFD